MSTVIFPQVRVFQEFNLLPNQIVDPLRPLIFGSEYRLHRYTAAEKVLAGAYNPDLDTDFLYAASPLNKLASSTVDQGFTKVHLEEALLQYYFNAASCAVVANSKNRVRFPSVVVKGGNGSTLNGSFFGRDVTPGDHIRLEAVVSGTRYVQTAEVTGFAADTVASSIAAATADAANQGTVTASNPVSATSTGTTTAITCATGGVYDGVPSGVITETYTITCRRGSSGGDLRTALLDITSSSGTDNVLGFAPTVNFGAAFNVGTRGTTATMTLNAATDIVAGVAFQVTVRTVYTVVVATSSGTYTGSEDTTYILTCTTGGSMTGGAVLKVFTNNGFDNGAPLTVTAPATALDIGNYGVRVAFDAGTVDTIRKGDTFYVVATSAKPGAIKTIIFDRSLPTQLISGSPNLDATLYIHKASLELPKQITGNTTATNWTQTAAHVRLESGAKVYDASWRAGLFGLSIVSADVFVHWRERIIVHADKIYEVDNLTDLDDLFTTPIDPDNPLVYAANKALLNSNGTAIRLMAVESEDLAGYVKVLEKSEVRDDVYALVPLTFDLSIQQEVSGHVNAMSSPEIGLWRIAFISSQDVNPQPIVDTLPTDGVSDVLATIVANGSLFDVDLTSGAIAGAATFDAANVGDTLRVNFTVDTNGNETWQEIPIVSVESDTQVKIGVSPTPLPGTPVKIQVYRTLDASGLSVQVGTNGGRFANRRVFDVYPDDIESGGVTVAGYFLAAAVAGLAGGVAPHQGLTNLAITGFDNTEKVTTLFNRSQLDNMASAGRWIVNADAKSGAVITRHQLSTDTTDLNTRELSVVKNVDSISYVFKNELRKYIGRTNVTPSLLSLLETDILGTINFLKQSGFTQSLGGQLIGAEIKELRAHATLKDRVVCTLNLDIPYPLNNIDLHLVV